MIEHAVIVEVSTKRCNHCGEEKPLSAFGKRTGRLDGLHGTCRLCHRKYANEYNKNHPDKFREYGRRNRQKNGEKRNRKAREWRKAHPERAKELNRKNYLENAEKIKARHYVWQLKRAYNLTVAEYDEMLKSQNGRCAICGGTNKNGYRLAVDHDHKTGKVRALLCSKCNLGIGYFNDDEERIEAVLCYLKQFAKQKA